MLSVLPEAEVVVAGDDEDLDVTRVRAEDWVRVDFNVEATVVLAVAAVVPTDEPAGAVACWAEFSEVEDPLLGLGLAATEAPETPGAEDADATAAVEALLAVAEPSAAVTGQMVVETATTTVVTSPVLQAEADGAHELMVEEEVEKMVLVVNCVKDEVEVLVLVLTAAAGVVVAEAEEATGVVCALAATLLSLANKELTEASEAVTGQIVVSTTTTTVVSAPFSSVEVEVP